MKVKIGDTEVVLEEKHLAVDEVSLNEFLKKFASIFNYYSTMWAKAQYLHYVAEDKVDVTYGERFQFYKENEGGSDKLVDAKVKSHPDVINARALARNAKYAMQLLNTYLRAMDKAHVNALNLGYNIRKEMDKIFPQSIKNVGSIDADVDKQLDEMFSKDTA